MGSRFKDKGDSYTDDCDVDFGHSGQFAVFNCSVGLGCSEMWGNCGGGGWSRKGRVVAGARHSALRIKFSHCATDGGRVMWRGWGE